MATYRLEAWVFHQEHDFEDQIEEMVIPALREVGLAVTAGPCVFRIYPNGEAGSPWSNLRATAGPTRAQAVERSPTPPQPEAGAEVPREGE